MIEFCYKKIEEYLKEIKNSQEEYIFQQSRRLVRENPDFDFIAANVTEDNPYCLISVSGYKENPMGFLFDIITKYEITDIEHTGTGTATYQITGNHKGNNSYVLKITTGGTVGTEPYPQYSIQINGGDWSTPADIPGDGKISISDGTIFEFEVDGLVVTDDIYSWQTIAKRVNISKEKEIDIKIRIEIWAKTKKELFETAGYFAQLSSLLIDRYVTDGEQFIRQLPGSPHWLQSDFEKENEITKGAQEVIYHPAIFTTKEDALVGELIIQGG